MSEWHRVSASWIQSWSRIGANCLRLSCPFSCGDSSANSSIFRAKAIDWSCDRLLNRSLRNIDGHCVATKLGQCAIARTRYPVTRRHHVARRRRKRRRCPALLHRQGPNQQIILREGHRHANHQPQWCPRHPF